MHKEYDVQEIDPNDVEFSDFNPRGEKEEDILNEPAFEQLKESIFKYGVLVPIVVHAQKVLGKKKYRLVDGERRLRAALATKASTIPANIAEGTSPLDDLKKAFQTHMLRKDWSPLAKARALKRLVLQMKSQGKQLDKKDLLEELQTATGCGDKELKDLMRVIRFPDSVLASVENRDLRFSHLVQIEESCIEPVQSVFPALIQKIGKNAARLALVEKAKSKVLTDTRALMYYIVPVITRAKQEGPAEKRYAASLIRRFIRDDKMSAEEVLREFERRFPRIDQDTSNLAKEAIGATQLLGSLLSQIRGNDFATLPILGEELRRELESLKTATTRMIGQLRRVRA